MKRGNGDDRHLGRIALTLSCLLLLAVAYTLHTVAVLLIPLMLAAFLSILFFPLVRRARRYGVPRFVTSGLLILTLISGAWLIGSMLVEPAREWLKDAPLSLRQLREESLQNDQDMKDIKALAKEVDELTEVENKEDLDEPQSVKIKEPGVLEDLMEQAPRVAGQGVIVMVLTFFLLITADTILLKIVRLGRTWSQRRKIVTIARSIQHELSHYLGLITVINICLGVATGLFLFALDVPNALLWGTVVTLFNFAPYLGAMVSTLLLTVVGLTTFATPAEALLVPGGFLFLTILEGQVITPTLVGRNLRTNPTFVLMSVIFWGWLWGIAGALMAVPILTCFKVFCDRYPPMHLVGDFLSSDKNP